MSFTIKVLPSGHTFTNEPDETILDAALRAGMAFPYGCRGGACGACIGQVVSGEIRYDDEPMGLTEAQATVGMSLFCVAKPVTDLTIEIHEVGAVEEIPVKKLPAKVAKLKQLNSEVMALFLKLPESERLQYLAGQYVEFIMADGRKRAFSIANAPHHDELLEFHIRRIKGGEFTEHVFTEMKVGEIVRIEGPRGSFFLREDSERPIILLATGTGFGPVKAIVEHMVAEQSSRPVYLYWGARTADGLYADSLIRDWESSFPNIRYRPVLSQPDETWEGRKGHVQQVLLEEFEDLSGYEVYACGHPEMVYSARDAVVARGVEPDHCYSDAFSWAVDKG